MHDTLLLLYVLVDDFNQRFLPQWQRQLIAHGVKRRQRLGQLSPSEIMTIIIHFQQSGYRNFKHYYCHYVCKQLATAFPRLVSYPRFVALTKTVLVPLTVFSQTCLGQGRGIYFVDATAIKACHSRREHQHRVFAEFAKKSKTSMGWFYGFKLHLVINDCGEIMRFKFTAGNVDDRQPVPDLVKHLTGRLFGDKGYISQSLVERLATQGIALITKLKKNMQAKVRTTVDKILLRKRAIIETVNDQLKNISQLEHTRHRSIFNFMVNGIAALIAYMLQPKKPSLHLQWHLLTPTASAYP